MDTQMTGMTWKVCGVTDLISITTCIQFFPATISNKITLSGSSVALQWPFQKTGLSPGVSAVKELTLEICLRLLINCVLSNSIRPHSGSLGAHSHLTLSMILLRSCVSTKLHNKLGCFWNDLFTAKDETLSISWYPDIIMSPKQSKSKWSQRLTLKGYLRSHPFLFDWKAAKRTPRSLHVLEPPHEHVRPRTFWCNPRCVIWIVE